MVSMSWLMRYNGFLLLSLPRCSYLRVFSRWLPHFPASVRKFLSRHTKQQMFKIWKTSNWLPILVLSWAMFGTRKGALKEKRLVMTTTHQFVFYLQCIPLQSMEWPFMNRHLHIVADYDDLLSFKQCQVQTHLYHRLINRTKLIFWVGACSLRNVLI